jgi:Ca2+-transporting ATPase
VIQPISTSVKGRVRYKVSGLYRSEQLKEYLSHRLLQNDAILEVMANTLTGSVLIRYNSGNTPQTIASLLVSVLSEYTRSNTAKDAQCGYNCSLESSEKGESEPRPTARLAQREEDSTSVKRKLEEFPVHGDVQKSEPWHVMEKEGALASFKSSRTSGLSRGAAAEHLGEYGPNLLQESDSRSALEIFIDQFRSLPVALLGVAAGISVLTGGLADAMVILGVVAINGAIGYVTESESEKTIHALKSLVRPSAGVIRDGLMQEVPAEEVVPGDILVLKPGSYVSADARLLEVEHLSVDESALTGESLPVVKTVEPLSKVDVPLADRTNMVYMGTLVTGGQGFAVVVATGQYTEVGHLQMLLGEAQSPETPMEKQLNTLGNQLVLISGAACGIVFVIGFLRGYGFVQMLKTSISLAVAAVPEGLPTVATTTLALGIKSMKKHRVLIRQLEAVETLGSVQTICFDKTGTITQNRMTVIRVFTGMESVGAADGHFFAQGKLIDPSEREELLRLIQASVLCNESTVAKDNEQFVLNGSPTENALIHLAISASMDIVRLREQYPLLKTNYRSENRLFMGTLHESGDGKNLIALKGSPLEVLSMCEWHMKDGAVLPLTEDDRFRIEVENEQMAGDGLRVLGTAYAMIDGEEGFHEETRFIWLGLIGMADPIRPGVKELIAQFHQAGIETVMITGDQSPTAYAIGKELDLSRGKQVEIMDSTHLTDIEPELMSALAQRVHVFSRVSPAHKLQIVQALQRAGKVVAMTGDGINDGPALKAADIGIAMGEGGTDMAREVADVVLEDDNLETMIVAVRDGRTIHDNIRKSLHFLLATNFSEIMVMFLTTAAGIGAPLNAMQLLWINLLSDIFPGLALALEPPEPGVLHRPPKSPDESIVNSSDFKRLTFESATMSVSSLTAYGYGIMKYGMGTQAGTLAFQGLTLGQLLHALSCRSESRSIFDKEKLPPNKYLNLALGGSFALQILTMFVPGLQRLLGIAPVGLIDSLVIGGRAVLPLIVNEATKKR